MFWPDFEKVIPFFWLRPGGDNIAIFVTIEQSMEFNKIMGGIIFWNYGATLIAVWLIGVPFEFYESLGNLEYVTDR